MARFIDLPTTGRCLSAMPTGCSGSTTSTLSETSERIWRKPDACRRVLPAAAKRALLPWFNYMIMQSYDFYSLYKKYGCTLQCGGDDQWSIFWAAPADSPQAREGCTRPDLPAFARLRGLRWARRPAMRYGSTPTNQPLRLLPILAQRGRCRRAQVHKAPDLLPLEQIDEMDDWEGARLNEAKEILAYE